MFKLKKQEGQLLKNNWEQTQQLKSFRCKYNIKYSVQKTRNNLDKIK